MSNPKEKAEELYYKYSTKGLEEIKSVLNRVVRKNIAKQCALIAVDEIIRVLQDEQDWYYQEVKQELEKI